MSKSKIYSIRETQPEDTQNFEMYISDAREVYLTSGLTPEVALQRCLELSSKSYSVFLNDQLVGIFGVGPLEHRRGCVWFLRTNEFLKVSIRDFFTISKACLQWLEPGYDRLENRVWVNHTRTIKWLERLGFTFGEAFRIDRPGFSGGPQNFLPFYKVNQCSNL